MLRTIDLPDGKIIPEDDLCGRAFLVIGKGHVLGGGVAGGPEVGQATVAVKACWGVSDLKLPHWDTLARGNVVELVTISMEGMLAVRRALDRFSAAWEMAIVKADARFDGAMEAHRTLATAALDAASGKAP